VLAVENKGGLWSAYLRVPDARTQPIMTDRIIVAEDNQQLRDALAELLEQRGYSVLAVADGVAAESAALEDCSLLVLDMLLPKKQGFQVAEALRLAGSTVPLICISGVYKTPPQIKEARDRLGAKEYLVKPFDGTVFLAAVEAALGKAPNPVVFAAAPGPRMEPFPSHGSTLDHPVGLLLMRLWQERLSGMVDLMGVGERIRIFCFRGMLAMAQSSREGRHIGAELVRLGLLPDTALRAALKEVAQKGVGLFKAIVSMSFVDEARAREGYKTLVPLICTEAVSVMGRFRWTPGDAWTRMLPAVSVPILPSLMEGLKAIGPAEAEKIVAKKRSARLVRGPFFDRFAPGIEQAFGPDVTRAINGRARLSQIVEAAPGPDQRGNRLRQAHAMLCLQAAVALEDAAAAGQGTSEPSAAMIPSAAPAPAPVPVPVPAGPAAPTPTFRPAAVPAAVALVASPRATIPPELRAVLAEAEQRFLAVKEQTHFQVLGVTETDEPGVVKKAYFALAAKFHADKFAGLDLGAVVKAKLDAVFARVMEANDVLSKPQRRAEYMAELKLKAAGANTDITAIFEAESHFTKAEAVLLRGDFASARKLLDQAIRLDPKDLYRAYHLYVSWRTEGCPKEPARKLMTDLDALSAQVAIPRVHEFLGSLAKGAGDYAAATRYFKRVMTEPQGNKALAQRELQQIEKLTLEGEKTKGGVLGKLFKS
jgi:CheY-like chemotaxis protein/DnaJ-domain-containing protein 1